MKREKRRVFFALLVLVIAGILAGCATTGPQLGTASETQLLLNQLPAVPVAGKNLKFEFGGDAWIATLDGKDFLAGTFTSADSADGSIINLSQTHAYSDEKKPGIGGEIGWVKTPGADIVLEYKKGPPASLSVKN
ncbi:hypothetical protein LJC14_00600 [Treponema sp. OttesenSCG-928-L16]|nr:hypothetical protein [Treponema sp. OttesenSCG-928-L16]